MAPAIAAEGSGAALLALLAGRATQGVRMPAVLITELLAVGDAGCTGYVACAGTVTSARTTVALRGTDVGSSAVVMMAGGDAQPDPVILGVLLEPHRGSAELPVGQVALSADGRRMTVCAKDQLELRCGASSITLTSAGRIVIDGEALLTRASGPHRIVGGSVQIN
jgi:hypothetical protein